MVLSPLGVLLFGHKFMVAKSRIEVDHGGAGGTAPDPMTWDQGSIIKTRASSLRVTIGHASLPSPRGFLDSSWCGLSLSPITQEGVAVWPYCVNMFLEFTSFWPLSIGLRVLLTFGNMVLLILSCLLSLTPPHHLRARRPLVGTEIRRGCLFIRSLFRPLPPPPLLVPWGFGSSCSLPAQGALHQAHSPWSGTVRSWPLIQAPGTL